MQINFKDTLILHYDMTLAFNLMLLTFLISTDDAIKFCSFKYRSWKEKQMISVKVFRRIGNRKRVEQLENVMHTWENNLLQPFNRNLVMIDV